MTYEEIKELHKRLDKREHLIAEGRIDSGQDDNSIAQLATTQGWEVLRANIESMIVELLRPVDFSDETPMDVRGAVGEARKFGIEIGTKIIGIVESTRAAKIIEKENKHV